MRPGLLWLLIGLLLGANIYESHFMMGTVLGWQVWWFELDILVIAGVVTVSNLYVQGGMRLQHVATSCSGSRSTTLFSSLVINVTAVLVEKFIGQPLDPTFGMRFQVNNYGIGIGDLLVYAVFTSRATRPTARRRRGSRSALPSSSVPPRRACARRDRR